MGVIEVRGARLDLDYVRRWADALGLRDLAERAFVEAGIEQG